MSESNRFRKRISMIGSISSGMGTSGTWTRDYNGTIAYRMGSKDSLAGLAQRYMGGIQHTATLAAMQPAAVRSAGYRAGTLLRMPAEAVETARALGFVREYESPREQASGTVGKIVEIGSMSPGDLLILPSDVENTLNQVDQEVETVSKSANQPALDQNTHDAFVVFYNGWKSFYANARPVSMIPLRYLDTYHQAVDYEQKNRQWEATISKTVPLVGPSVQGQPPGSGFSQAISDTVKNPWFILAAAGGILAVLKLKKVI